MPLATLSSSTFEKLQLLAVPLQDSVDSVVARLADAALSGDVYSRHMNGTGVGDSESVAELWQSAKRSKSQSEDDLHEWRRGIWTDILDYIGSRQSFFRVQSPNDDSWSTISIGRSNIVILLTLTPKRRCIGCELYLNIPWKSEAMEALMKDREAIESEIGQTLTWDLKPGKKSASIYLEGPVDPKVPENREVVKIWMHDMSVRFYKAFHDRVMSLRAG